MIQSINGSERKVVGSAVLSQYREVSAGRKNLLSSLWGVRSKADDRAMPNGDPSSLMLWGVEEDGAERRLAGRNSKV